MRCLITFETSPHDYSPRGLRMLGRNLTALEPLAYSAEEQVRQAIVRSGKTSVQGVQPKLSAVLNVRRHSFDLVDRFGTYIIKPPHRDYPQMPENEALTMRLAKIAGIEVPLHGLLRSVDGGLSYLVKRFDRLPSKKKLHLEDFAQITGRTRLTKYDSSMEKVADALDCCTFPAVARMELFKRSLFNFIVGNEDMHLKNFSVIYRNKKRELAPGYDFLNSTLIWQLLGRSEKDVEELALPLAGKKRKLNRQDWFDYYGRERLRLTDAAMTRCWETLRVARIAWDREIGHSFLSDDAKCLYLELVTSRMTILEKR